MLENEKKIAKTLSEAFKALPDNKKERFLGYAEGVVDMTENHKKSPLPHPTSEQAG